MLHEHNRMLIKSLLKKFFGFVHIYWCHKSIKCAQCLSKSDGKMLRDPVNFLLELDMYDFNIKDWGRSV